MEGPYLIVFIVPAGGQRRMWITFVINTDKAGKQIAYNIEFDIAGDFVGIEGSGFAAVVTYYFLLSSQFNTRRYLCGKRGKRSKESTGKKESQRNFFENRFTSLHRHCHFLPCQYS